MVRVSSPAKLRPWSEFTAKMVMGVVPVLVNRTFSPRRIAQCVLPLGICDFPVEEIAPKGAFLA